MQCLHVSRWLGHTAFKACLAVVAGVMLLHLVALEAHDLGDSVLHDPISSLVSKRLDAALHAETSGLGETRPATFFDGLAGRKIFLRKDSEADEAC